MQAAGQTGAVLSTTVAQAVERSPVPAVVGPAVERLVAARPELGERLAEDPALLAATVAVLAASRSLTRLLETDGGAMAVLAELDRPPPPPPPPPDGVGAGAAAGTGPEDGVEALVRWQRRAFLHIAARDLTGQDDLEATGRALADLSGVVLGRACVLAGATDLVVVGMGKLGGRELNYASDVDVMFAAERVDADLERRARAAVAVARRCYRVDLNLRPEGRDGALVRSLESYGAYWERWAQPWEFQALLKARPVAGPEAHRGGFSASAAEHLWTRSFGPEDLRAVRAMKARAEADVARRGAVDLELKRGPGGIRDVEFAVQLLQLVHGGADPELRTPATLDTLAELADAGYVGRPDAEALADAYRFLRTVEHRVQLVEEHQVHALPPDPGAQRELARNLGYRDTVAAGALDRFRTELGRHRVAARSIHERIWFRPLLDAFAATGTVTTLSTDVAAARLAAFGFTDPERARQAFAELTRGLTRSSRLMQQLLPLVLDWLSSSPDPDLGLLGLRSLASGPQRSMELASAFRESPELARNLCCVLGTSALLSTTLGRNPDLIASLGRSEGRLRSREELVASTRAAAAWRPDPADRRGALKRFTDREGLAIAAGDVLGTLDVAAVGPALSRLAEATLEAVLDVVRPGLPFAVVAQGRFGGAELSYASDLDVVFVYEGTGTSDAGTSDAGDFEEAERAATAVLRFLGGPVPVLYDVDPDLRPEGRQGPLARSLDGYRSYLERWAQPWERLALVRARPAAGDAGLGERFLATVEPFVWQAALADADRREIRRIKARVERERIPAGEDPEFHLKLGRGGLADVEFCTQLLQLDAGVRGTATVPALEALGAAGAIGDHDRQVLTTAYRFCERVRNRWFLVNSAPGDSLPRQPEKLTRLARSLDMTVAELRDEYRRATGGARRVVERLFYGRI